MKRRIMRLFGKPVEAPVKSLFGGGRAGLYAVAWPLTLNDGWGLWLAGLAGVYLFFKLVYTLFKVSVLNDQLHNLEGKLLSLGVKTADLTEKLIELQYRLKEIQKGSNHEESIAQPKKEPK